MDLKLLKSAGSRTSQSTLLSSYAAGAVPIKAPYNAVLVDKRAADIKFLVKEMRAIVLLLDRVVTQRFQEVNSVHDLKLWPA